METYLTHALKRLEKAFDEIKKTRPYDKECEKLKMLQELVKEQVANENSRPTTR